MVRKGSGWHGESRRHSEAVRKGMKTRYQGKTGVRTVKRSIPKRIVENRTRLSSKSGSIELLNKTWETASTKNKKALLKAIGHHESWSKTKTIKEMVSRGGGMAVRDLHNLAKIWKERNPDVDVMFP